MAKQRLLNIIVTECPLKIAEKFNKWYNEVHVPMLMKYKGIKKTTRYKVMDEGKDKAQFIAIYEYDSKEDMAGLNASPEFKAAIEEMQETWKGQMFDIKMAFNCDPIKAWER